MRNYGKSTQAPKCSKIAARRPTPSPTMLDEDGVLTPEAEVAANVSDEELRKLYRMMAICRRLDQEGLNLQRQGELGLWGPIRRPRGGAGRRGSGTGADRLDISRITGTSLWRSAAASIPPPS